MPESIFHVHVVVEVMCAGVFVLSVGIAYSVTKKFILSVADMFSMIV